MRQAVGLGLHGLGLGQGLGQQGNGIAGGRAGQLGRGLGQQGGAGLLEVSQVGLQAGNAALAQLAQGLQRRLDLVHQAQRGDGGGHRGGGRQAHGQQRAVPLGGPALGLVLRGGCRVLLARQRGHGGAVLLGQGVTPGAVGGGGVHCVAGGQHQGGQAGVVGCGRVGGQPAGGLQAGG